MLRFIYRVYRSRAASGYLDIKLFLARGSEEETFQGSFSLSELEWRVYRKVMNLGDCTLTSQRTHMVIDGERVDASVTIMEHLSKYD